MINEQLSMYDAACVNGKIWFSNNSYNGLFVMDSHTNNIKMIEMFPFEDEYGNALHKQVIEYKERLFFLPALADYISVYNIKENKFEASILVDRCDKEYTSGAFVDGNELWVLPIFSNQSVIRINMDTLEYEMTDFIINQCVEYAGIKTNDYILTRVSIYENNKIIFGIFNTDIICIYDYRNDRTEFIHTGIDKIFGCFYINGDIWIIPNGVDCIYLWNDNEKKAYEWEIEGYIKPQTSSKYYRPGNKIIDFNRKTLLLPSFGDEVYVSNDEKHTFEKTGIIIPVQDKLGEKITSFGVTCIDDDLLILPFSASFGVKINSSYGATTIAFNNSDKEFVDKKKQKYIREYFSPACENEHFRLMDYLKCVVS